MQQFGDAMWLDTTPVSIMGGAFTSTAAVLQLAGSDLLIWSPVPLTEERRRAIDAIGRVAHLYAPNLFHSSWIGDWADAYPDARVHAPAGLRSKKPTLRIDREHGADPDPSFDDLIEEVPIAGTRLGESMLLHRPSHAVLTADLVHNVGRPDGWAGTYAKMMGFYGRVGISRAIRWTAFPDHAATRASLDRVLAHDFDRVVVGHGAPITHGGKDALASAYTWL